MDKASHYWQQRYESGQTKWDMGQVSPPIKAYIDGLPPSAKAQRILIAGAGNAYEAAYLFQNGFEQVTIVDFAPAPLQAFAKKYPQFPKKQLVCADFFKLTLDAHQFDLALEQTFFCAIEPSLRQKYVQHMQRLLLPQGKLVGILFNTTFAKQGPPFGGQEQQYRHLFAPYFDILTMAPCYNSHPARQGSELFFIMQAKNGA